MLDNKIIDAKESGDDPYDFSGDFDDLLSSISSPPKSSSTLSHTGQIESWSDSNRTKHHRYTVCWRVAIVNKSSSKNTVFHGRTQNVSLSGLCILTDHSIPLISEVVIFLAIPALHHGQKERIIETHCSGMYNVLDSTHGQFRIGMNINQFKGDGKKILSEVLSTKLIKKDTSHAHY